MSGYDPRVTPARADLAASHLRGRVEATHFVDPRRRAVVVPVAPVRQAPRADAALATQALLGEAVDVYETTADGWHWGQLAGDGYVGWLPPRTLDVPGVDPTHRVAVLRTLVFPGTSIKEPPLMGLPMGARVTVERVEGAMAATPLGQIPVRHLAPVDAGEEDLVAVAERFIGTPYLWGGKSADGIDCSGLVQTALAACGINAPRDSDMQEGELGEAVDATPDDAMGLPPLHRGDLVFWPGHVAIARDAISIVHANGFHMAVIIEPLDEAIRRIEASGATVSSVRRLTPERP